jgi:two-component system, chemotaxis family, CheB/CheR fusion protein
MAVDREDARDESVDLPDAEAAAFRRLLDMLLAEHRFDFREYKTESLLRRVRARMVAVRVDGFNTYVDYIRGNAQEAAALFNSILINVTGFFRDPEAWDVLRAQALPAIVRAASTSGRLRVWSAGCSTGEEAYSAAILIAEALGDAASVDVKIYGTDIDDDALVTARQAAFRVDQLKDVPGDVLERHFVTDGHLHRVRRELRRWCIFGRHNVTQDPPLPQINLLLCRNLLIYFNAGLQERLLSRFGYAVREGGILFLGRSESLVARSHTFVPVSQNIFRRSGDPGEPLDVVSLRHAVAAAGEPRAFAAPASEGRMTVGAVVKAQPYPVILIGMDDTVREWNEAATGLYDIAADSAIGRQFRDLDISDRAEGLRARIEDVKRAVDTARLENVMLTRRSGEALRVDFWVTRVYDDRSRAVAILVAAWDGTAVARFREEIVRLAEQHSTAAEELLSTNEELQATNQELETTNEELQSTNKELVTTVDELQAANAELAARTAQLRRVSLYHAAVVNSVQDAIIVLDQRFMVTSWNPGAERLFGIPASAALGRDFFSLPVGWPQSARLMVGRIGTGENGERGGDVEFELPLDEGGAPPAVVRFVRLVDANGALQGILGLGRAR